LARLQSWPATFGAAALSYLEAAPRSAGTNRAVVRIFEALGEDTTLAEIDQEAAGRLRQMLLPTDASPSSYARHIVTPLRAVLNYAADLGWCNPPRLKARTRFLLPAEAERLIAAAAPHLQPLLVFLLGTGARMSEALELEWRDVDLAGGRAVFWQTKSGKRRVAELAAEGDCRAGRAATPGRPRLRLPLWQAVLVLRPQCRWADQDRLEGRTPAGRPRSRVDAA